MNHYRFIMDRIYDTLSDKCRYDDEKCIETLTFIEEDIKKVLEEIKESKNVFIRNRRLKKLKKKLKGRK